MCKVFDNRTIRLKEFSGRRKKTSIDEFFFCNESNFNVRDLKTTSEHKLSSSLFRSERKRHKSFVDTTSSNHHSSYGLTKQHESVKASFSVYTQDRYKNIKYASSNSPVSGTDKIRRKKTATDDFFLGIKSHFNLKYFKTTGECRLSSSPLWNERKRHESFIDMAFNDRCSSYGLTKRHEAMKEANFSIYKQDRHKKNKRVTSNSLASGIDKIEYMFAAIDYFLDPALRHYGDKQSENSSIFQPEPQMRCNTTGLVPTKIKYASRRTCRNTRMLTALMLCFIASGAIHVSVFV